MTFALQGYVTMSRGFGDCIWESGGGGGLATGIPDGGQRCYQTSHNGGEGPCNNVTEKPCFNLRWNLQFSSLPLLPLNFLQTIPFSLFVELHYVFGTKPYAARYRFFEFVCV